MNVAICGALAKFTGTDLEPEDLLEIAKDVEAQVIKVPTGLQDYRPAIYGGIAAIELHAGKPVRVALDVNPRELERRMVLCYTGEPRNSGTNNWEITKRHIDGDTHIFDCFERIRDTAAADARGADPRRLGRHGRVPGHRMGEPQAAGAGCHDAGHRGVDRAGHGRRGQGREGVRRRRWRLHVLHRAAPADVPAVREALADGGASLLDFRIETTGLDVTTE